MTRRGLLVLLAVAATLPAVARADQASAPGSTAAGRLDAGDSHTCAVLAGGGVRCWGFNANGQLGYGNEATVGDDEAPGAAGPVDLGMGRTATALGVGNFHSCAVLDDASVRCWGSGIQGQLARFQNLSDVGDNETPGSVAPVDLGAGRTARALTAGGGHTCALLDDANVRCWGYGYRGRLGYGSEEAVGIDQSPGSVGPVNLGAGRTATAVSAGNDHTCALLDNGQVRCWGESDAGALGYGNARDVGDDELPGTIAPIDLGTGRTAIAISAGGEHSCAILDNGSVRCWGNGADGRLGYGNTAAIGDDETPGGRALPAIACPSTTQCTAVDNTGQQVTFNPTAPGTPTPTTIDPNRDLNAIACPSNTQCTAVDNTGQQVTFNPTAPGTPTPTTIDPNRDLNAIACPSTAQCTAVDNTGQQVTFNPTAPGTPTPTTIDPNRDLRAIACPSTTQCTAVDNTGQQVTFNPTAPGTPTPTTIDPSPDRVLGAIACPSTTQCTAVDDTGQQVTFNPTAPGTPTPTTIDPSPDRVLGAIACPSTTQCTAVDDTGQQVTFNPTAPGTPTPTTIDPNRDLNAIACPSTTQCTAVDNAGQQVTFNPAAPGSPTATRIAAAAVAVDLGLGRTATAIGAGDMHTCALLDDGNVRCWGPGSQGQLGRGNADAIGDNEKPGSVPPVDLGPGRTAVAVSLGARHTCARLDDGSVRCWGYGGNGRLGHCSTRNIGDDESPAAAGPVALTTATGGGCVDASPTVPRPVPPPGAARPTASLAAALRAQAARRRRLRACRSDARRHAAGEIRRARRLSGEERSRTRRHVRRHRSRLLRTCARRHGRTPGRVTGLQARATSRTRVQLTFGAAGSDRDRPPAAQTYLVKQSRRPIRGARAFAGAQSLCSGRCRFPAASTVGGRVSLTVTDLRPGTTYHYAVAARDNVSGRLGPRPRAVSVRTPGWPRAGRATRAPQ